MDEAAETIRLVGDDRRPGETLEAEGEAVLLRVGGNVVVVQDELGQLGQGRM